MSHISSAVKHTTEYGLSFLWFYNSSIISIHLSCALNFEKKIRYVKESFDLGSLIENYLSLQAFSWNFEISLFFQQFIQWYTDKTFHLGILA